MSSTIPSARGGRRLALSREPFRRQETGADRAGDILEFLLAEVDESLVEPVARQAPGVLRNEDAAGLADPFEARCDIDAVAHEVAVAFLRDVSNMYADPEFDASFQREAGVALAQALLDLDCTPHRVNDAAELHENSVAGALDDPPMMGSDGRIDQIPVQRPEPRQRALLVEARKPAEADHVGGQDRGELSRLGHEPVPRSRHDPSTRLPAPGDAIRATC
jgi:hypothetical protein